MWNVSTLTFLRSLEWSILDKDIRKGKQRLEWCYFKYCEYSLWKRLSRLPFFVDVFFLPFAFHAKLSFLVWGHRILTWQKCKGNTLLYFLTHLSHFNVYFTTFSVFNLPYIMKCVHSYCRWCAHKQFQIICTRTYVHTQALRQFF